MRRPASSFSSDMQGQDSFLDVVANMVGILIILVTVVGVRAGHAPSDAPPADPARQRELETLQAESVSLQADVLDLTRQAKSVHAMMAARNVERERLATLVAVGREELERRRNKLGSESQAQYELNMHLTDAQGRLEQLERERASLQNVRPETIRVQSLPTPISKTVHGKEVHFQLRDNYIAHIPLDELLDELRSQARNKLWKLDGQAEFTDTVGPIEGFRLRYELGRFELSPEMQRETGRVGAVVRLIQWEILPVAERLGEPIDQALAEDSKFHRLIKSINPANTTMTIWTYPESFEAFRKLKAELHALGIPTASRPLPRNQAIGGSPEGTRSAAQ